MYIFSRPALYLTFSAVDVASQGIVGVVAYLPPIFSLPIFPLPFYDLPSRLLFLFPPAHFTPCALSLFYLLLT